MIKNMVSVRRNEAPKKAKGILVRIKGRNFLN
jgi:hypothetical protein